MKLSRWTSFRRFVFGGAAVAAAVLTSACKPQLPLPASNTSSTPAIQLSTYPPANTIVVGDQFRMEPANGTAPFTFRRILGDGTLTDSGIFTAPSTPQSVSLQVTDSTGLNSTYNFTIAPPLSITEGTSFDLATTNPWTFHTAGGAGTISFTLVSGAGTTTGAGLYTAGSTTGNTVLRASDQSSHTADITVVVHPRPQISPTSATIGVTKTATFSTSDGVSPYVYSVISGGGSFTGSTYTAGSSAGAVVVKSTDLRGNVSSATITVIGRPQIAPTTLSLAVNNTFTFTATSGFTPYVYSITSGGGTINSSSGLYTAPSTTGTTVVRVTDNVGNYTESTVTIVPALQIVPATITMAINDVYVFSRTGGVAPYVYSVVGTGTVNASTGSFTAPASVGTTKVRVTDARGNTSDATITVNAALALSPTTLTLAANDQSPFTASGGVPPYTYSVASGGGTITTGGQYTAPATAGTATVRVTDAFGNIVNATVTINPPLTIAATYTVIAANNTVTVTASNGVPGYAYSLVSGPGNVDGVSGLYTPSGLSGTAVLRATDSIGNTASVTVTVNPALTLTPNPATVAINENKTFSAAGGVSPFTYSIASGAGSITASTGVYTAPGTTGSASLKVTDALGNTATSAVTITNLQLTASPATIAANNTSLAMPTGGSPSYTYSLVSGPGSINASSGVYTPGASGSGVLRVTDSAGRMATTTVTVNPVLSISADRTAIASTNTATATAANGVGPYTYSLFSGPGAVNSSSGVYTPGTTGTGVVRATDSLGNTADVTITVSAALTLATNRPTIATNNTATVTASNGVTPYTYSVQSGPGGSTVNSSGVFTPGSAGTAVVKVTDAASNTATVSITINGPLVISPTPVNMTVNSTTTFTTTGGVSPITFTRTTGTGTVNSSTGVFTAPSSGTTATVTATDAIGNTSVASITFVQALSFAITSNQQNYNLKTDAVSRGWTDGQDIQVTINSGIVISASAPGTPAFTTGTFTGLTKVTIINNGTIVGAGGTGGGGSSIVYGGSAPGGAGGNAMDLRYAVSINNSSGQIFGGGGGGGSGAPSCDNYNGSYSAAAAGGGGGGGAGTAVGQGGPVSGSYGGGASVGNAATASSSTGGNGGSGGSNSTIPGYVEAHGGAGGNGGGYGADGSPGGSATAIHGGGGCSNFAGGAGGAAGKAVNTNAYDLTWLGGQNATQVKGATN